jgi:hypothetical protein
LPQLRGAPQRLSHANSGIVVDVDVDVDCANIARNSLQSLVAEVCLPTHGMLTGTRHGGHDVVNEVTADCDDDVNDIADEDNEVIGVVADVVVEV